MLNGVKYICDQIDSDNLSEKERFMRSFRDKGPIQRKLESVQFKPVACERHADVLRNFLMNDLEMFITEMNGSVNRTNICNEVPDDIKTKITLNNLPVSCSFLKSLFDHHV